MNRNTEKKLMAAAIAAGAAAAAIAAGLKKDRQEIAVRQAACAASLPPQGQDTMQNEEAPQSQKSEVQGDETESERIK